MFRKHRPTDKGQQSQQRAERKKKKGEQEGLHAKLDKPKIVRIGKDKAGWHKGPRKPIEQIIIRSRTGTNG